MALRASVSRFFRFGGVRARRIRTKKRARVHPLSNFGELVKPGHAPHKRTPGAGAPGALRPLPGFLAEGAPNYPPKEVGALTFVCGMNLVKRKSCGPRRARCMIENRSYPPTTTEGG